MKAYRFMALLCHLILVARLTAQEGIVAGVKDLVDQIQDQTRDRARLRVAVADLTDLEGSPTRLGQYLAEEMTTQLMRRGQVRVVERRLLGKVAEELRLNLSDIGLVDPASARRLGRVLGVDALIVGTLTPLQRTVRVHVRLIGTETAEVVAGASTLLLDADELKGGMEKVPTPPPAPSPAPSPAPAPPPSQPVRPAGNLLTNGDFAQAWTVGWTRQIGNLEKGENAVEVVHHPGAGRVVHLRHVGESHMALYQVVPVEGVDLLFEASFQMKAWEGPIWGFSGTGTAAVRLIYEDRDGKRLGETNILKTVKNLFADTPLLGVPQPPRSGSREHQIYVDERWYDGFRLNVAQEIRDYLPGVNPDQVARIAVALMVAGDGGDRCGSELWANNLKLRYNPL